MTDAWGVGMTEDGVDEVKETGSNDHLQKEDECGGVQNTETSLEMFWIWTWKKVTNSE